MGYFDNLTESDSLKNTYLAWGIIGLLISIMFIVKCSVDLRKSGETSRRYKIVASIVLVSTIFYLLISSIWYIAMYAQNDNP